MNTEGSEQFDLAASQFAEQYGVTSCFFTRKCLLPSLLAVTTFSCYYGGVLVEVLERPAWKTRLRALRTLLALSYSYGIEGQCARVPKGSLGLRQLTLIASSFLETDLNNIRPEIWVPKCLGPCLQASGRVFLFYFGKLVDSTEYQLHDIQLEAVTIVGKLKKLFPDECDNAFSVTHRDVAALVSAARQNGKRTIQLNRRTQLVHVR